MIYFWDLTCAWVWDFHRSHPVARLRYLGLLNHLCSSLRLLSSKDLKLPQNYIRLWYRLLTLNFAVRGLISSLLLRDLDPVSLKYSTSDLGKMVQKNLQKQIWTQGFMRCGIVCELLCTVLQKDSRKKNMTEKTLSQRIFHWWCRILMYTESW